MDPQFLKYYNAELQHLREMGGEFAAAYPKVASRLTLDQFECADPYVERLLEGFAFLAARVHQRLDAEFPLFAQQILSVVHPHLLSVIPSCAIVQATPDLAQGNLADGFTLPRGTSLRSLVGRDDPTACEFRTVADIDLWPLTVAAAEYLPSAAAVAAAGLGTAGEARAAIRLRLTVDGGLPIADLPLDRLRFHLRGGSEIGPKLYEHLFKDGCGIAVRGPDAPAGEATWLPSSAIEDRATDRANAMLPLHDGSFDGYRLIQEYFTFPQRFQFVDLAGLRRGLKPLKGSAVDLYILLSQVDPLLENRIDTQNFALHCAPAVNLFPKRADRIPVQKGASQHHVIPDRTRPMDFEVFEIERVEGMKAGSKTITDFRRFYDISGDRGGEQTAFFSVARRPRQASETQRRKGARSNYLGSEVFLTLVDAREQPYPGDIAELAVECLCTNRDLPMHIPVGRGQTDFTLTSGAPVAAIRCLAGPTRPRPPIVFGERIWRIVSHLSLNYLSLCDTDDRQGAAALRELLSVYADPDDPVMRRQIEGLRSVTTQPVIRRVPGGGIAAVARGLQVALTLEERAFEGSGMFLFARVMEAFLARYVTLNSFVEMALIESERGELHRWPPRIGRQHLL